MFANIDTLIEFHPVTIGVIIAAALAAILLFVSAFASGSEIAFFSLSPREKCRRQENKYT